MAFEEIDCINPVKNFDAIPPNGVRFTARKLCRRKGGVSKFIGVKIGKDLARKTAMTLPLHNLRVLFGSAEDAGKVMIAVDQERGRFAAKRDSHGNYGFTINEATADGLFSLEFSPFAIIDVDVQRAPGCPVAMVFKVDASMLVAD